MAYEKDTPEDSDQDFVRKALEKYERSYQREQSNITDAISDLEFRAGIQWDETIRRQRETDHRPALTINKIPAYVRSVSGEMRIKRPGLKVVPVDSRGDPKTAEVLEGLLRYIENRSDSQHAYNAAIDSQVVAGIGHWRIFHEYADDSSFEQELRINAVDDGVSIVWDADSILPNREDARCCWVPVDVSHEVFRERYPDAPLDDFTLTVEGNMGALDGWYGDDFVRIAEYWERVPEKRTLCLLPDSTVDDVTDQPDRLKAHKAAGYRIEERESHRIYRSVISSCHLLEKPKPWPGRYIPIVPVLGEEVQISRKKYRHGVVRYMKDSQRSLNYFRSAQTEAIGLQPKAPWLVTEKNVEDYQDQWLVANQRNFPYLLWKPDGRNNNAPPQRVPAAMDTAGMVQGLELATQELMEVTGIYDASLGKRSNEVSAKAINARDNQSNVGTAVYADNFARALKHSGRILIDLIPNIYDSERVLRILGEDGKADLVNINQRGVDPMTGLDHTLNDVTVACYDIQLEAGPSYASRREEAQESMLTFLSQAPGAAPAILDLLAASMNWPNADKISKRLKTQLPPQIQQMEAEESGEPPPPPSPPPPELIMKQQEMQAEQQKLQVELHVQEQKAKSDIAIAEMRLAEKRIELEIKKLDLQAAQVAAEGQQVKSLYEAAFKMNGSPQNEG